MKFFVIKMDYFLYLWRGKTDTFLERKINTYFVTVLLNFKLCCVVSSHMLLMMEVDYHCHIQCRIDRCFEFPVAVSVHSSGKWLL